LKRGTVLNKLTTSQFRVTDTTVLVIRTAIIEETPQSFTGISSIEVYSLPVMDIQQQPLQFLVMDLVLRLKRLFKVEELFQYE
jgi:hypothetical protein